MVLQDGNRRSLLLDQGYRIEPLVAALLQKVEYGVNLRGIEGLEAQTAKLGRSQTFEMLYKLAC